MEELKVEVLNTTIRYLRGRDGSVFIYLAIGVLLFIIVKSYYQENDGIILIICCWPCARAILLLVEIQQLLIICVKYIKKNLIHYLTILKCNSTEVKPFDEKNDNSVVVKEKKYK